MNYYRFSFYGLDNPPSTTDTLSLPADPDTDFWDGDKVQKKRNDVETLTDNISINWGFVPQDKKIRFNWDFVERTKWDKLNALYNFTGGGSTYSFKIELVDWNTDTVVETRLWTVEICSFTGKPYNDYYADVELELKIMGAIL